MSNGTSKIGFFMAGIGLGAVAAILYAPKSGKETRRMIAVKAEEGRDYLESRGRELRRQAENTLDHGKEYVNRQKDRLAEALKAS
jgi:gas vesicle protein